MPYMKNGKRDYSAEKRWEATKATGRPADRAQRMRARRKAEKEGLVSKNDGKHVDHVNGLKAGNGRKNLRAVSSTQNLHKEAIRKKKDAKRGK